MIMIGTEELPAFAAGAVNLASARLGARALFATDEFFAPLSRMLSDALPEFDPALYDDNGKYMDGWESRRKRVAGHDHAVIRLAMAGRIAGFDIDTHWFTGNYPPFASVEAAYSPDGDPDPNDDALWTELVAKAPLGASSHHFFENADRDRVWTHIRLHIYPDGGVARLRVYGTAAFDWSRVGAGEEIDLGYIFHGGKSLAWSDAHYGHPDKMLEPGRGNNMGDGWETKRRRGPGHDWAIIRLGHAGIIRKVTVDTHFYKGNFPDTCELLGAYLPDLGDTLSDAEIAASEQWKPILGRKKLAADTIHNFEGADVAEIGPVTHVRYAMHPDGGTMRLRLIGTKQA
ncbi:allantoicase [Rhizobium alvei]|uniref:Probable allantoicase n=1 Tax=Rhizobium alvei TaxID=1132659 RepID=A0ABT8YHE2_9HYPH|nr:allantoicase [Rhizobium alvei]MDO6962738.1 allantoicase [Rhizobium alvei]